MHRTIGLTGYIGPLTLTRDADKIMPPATGQNVTTFVDNRFDGINNNNYYYNYYNNSMG